MAENGTRKGTHLFGSGGLVEVSNLFEIPDKLNEARFFVEMMNHESRPAEFRWLTSACLNACRSAVDWLAWNVCHAKDGADRGWLPDERATQKLEKYIRVDHHKGKQEKVFGRPVHPLLVKLGGFRQETAHRSPLWIDRLPPREGELLATPGEEFAFAEFAVDPRNECLLHVVPGPRVIPFCREVIGLLQRIEEEIQVV